MSHAEHWKTPRLISHLAPPSHFAGISNPHNHHQNISISDAKASQEGKDSFYREQVSSPG